MTAVQTTVRGRSRRAPDVLFNLFRLSWLSLLAVAIFVTAAGAWMTDRYYREVFTPSSAWVCVGTTTGRSA